MAKNKKKEKIHFKENIKEYFSFFKGFRVLFFSALFFVLIKEGMKIAEKFLLKMAIDNGTAFSNNSLTSTDFTRILLFLGIAFIILLIVRYASDWIELHFTNRLEGGMILKLKQKYFNHTLDLDHKFHVSHKTGSMISKISRGSRAMESMTDVILFNLAPLIFQVIVLTISFLYLDFTSAVIIFGIITVFVLHSLFIQKVQQPANLEANKADDREKAHMGDIFTNIESIRYFGKEMRIKGLFARLSEKTRKAMIRHWDYFRIYSSNQNLILGLGTLLLMYFSMKRLLSGEITLGTIIFIYTTYFGLAEPLYRFAGGLRESYRSIADLQATFEYGKIQKEIIDKKGAKKIEVQRGEVAFNNISFNYGKRKIFEKFDLLIPAEKKVALVGHSGCGKTSLIKLLYRFYDVDSGSITIDNEDIREFKQEFLRSEMSIVPQECILFNDTIYNNIAFSNPKASREKVMDAIKFAQLDKIIKTLPKKERTIVGERGIKLSGGEKQRVSIARAILADKKILVLDEATSSLDSETEYEIQRDLSSLMKGRTSIIIAHRLSTIMHADTIIVMKKGKIVQAGNHNQLIREGGEYKKLWNLQKGGYIK
ncbi:MAG: ABC transporter ATP-binding protein/permease [Nanoarchaeota archaeon]|nr:ABC transporter ATP-binding protein/permease [Nanoarchaeota archaeon]